MSMLSQRSRLRKRRARGRRRPYRGLSYQAAQGSRGMSKVALNHVGSPIRMGRFNFPNEAANSAQMAARRRFVSNRGDRSLTIAPQIEDE